MPLIKQHMLKGLVHITGGGFQDNIPRSVCVGAKSFEWRRRVVDGSLSASSARGHTPRERTTSFSLYPSIFVASKVLLQYLCSISRRRNSGLRVCANTSLNMKNRTFSTLSLFMLG